MVGILFFWRYIYNMVKLNRFVGGGSASADNGEFIQKGKGGEKLRELDQEHRRKESVEKEC